MLNLSFTDTVDSILLDTIPGVDESLTPAEIAERIKNAMQLIFDARNFSKRVVERIEAHPDYTHADDPLKSYTRFLQEKIYVCFGGTDAPPESDSKYDAWATQASTDAFAAPPTRIIKSWLTLNNYEKNVHFLDHSEKGRDYMFLLCFALGLDYEQAHIFFDQIFADRFFVRRAQDILLHPCLGMSLPYHAAFALWDKLESVPVIDPATTQTIIRQLPLTEQEALLCARSMQSLDPAAQKQRILDTIDLLKQTLKDRWQAEEDAYVKNEKKKQEGAKADTGIAEDDYPLNPVGDKDLFERFFPAHKEEYRNLRLSANLDALKQEKSFLYVVLLFHKACPTLDDLQNRERNHGTVSFYTLRNLFILLHFFVFWSDPDNNKHSNSFDAYEQEANLYLAEFALPELYLCNPYDFIFLQASIMVLYNSSEDASQNLNPIHVFHSIVSSILAKEDA